MAGGGVRPRDRNLSVVRDAVEVSPTYVRSSSNASEKFAESSGEGARTLRVLRASSHGCDLSAPRPCGSMAHMTVFDEVRAAAREIATLPSGLKPSAIQLRQLHGALLKLREHGDTAGFGSDYGRESYIRGCDEILGIFKNDPSAAADHLLSAPMGDYAPNPLDGLEKLV